MVISQSYELYSFAVAVAAGLLCGVIYDFVKSLRLCFGRAALFDLLFWVLTALVPGGMWLCLLGGEVRWYMAAGVFAALCLYLLALERPVFFIISRAVRKTYCFFNIILKFLLTVKTFLGTIILHTVKNNKEVINDEKAEAQT